ncbi:MAG: lytic murein transglycosylase [Sutterella sp.]|nr:lytic murein transglycosylase [Sutterella sp.]
MSPSVRSPLFGLAFGAWLALAAPAFGADTPASEVRTAPAKPAVNVRAKSPSASDYLEREEVRSFLKEVSEAHGIPLDWLESEVAVARYSALAERYTTPKPGANRRTTPEKNYLLYSKNLVNEERIAKGVEFLKRHDAAFREAEALSGVDRYAVAAVIGIETIYGRNMGRFRVLDALMTLSFDYTRRAAFFRSELSSFLDFCWREKISPVTVLGSYAGAIGLGQFMPSSLDAYGRDGDGDGRVDIVGSEADAIASVAAFLRAHGWVSGIEPLYPVEADRDIYERIGAGGITVHTTLAGLREEGVRKTESVPLPDDEPVLLVDLPWVDVKNRRGTHWFVGTRNFAAILRYNRSYFYAAAVSALAERIAERERSLEKSAEPSQSPSS